MKQATKQTQAKTNAELTEETLSSLIPKIQDLEGEARAAIDDLLALFMSDVSDSEMATALMKFLARLAYQDDLTTRDYLMWAVTRCYHWTQASARSQDAYLAALFGEAAS